MSKMIKTATVAMMAFGSATVMADENKVSEINFDSKVGVVSSEVNTSENQNDLLANHVPWPEQPTCRTSNCDTWKFTEDREDVNDRVTGSDLLGVIS